MSHTGGTSQVIAEPIHWLYGLIENSSAFPPEVKDHVLQIIKPYKRMRAYSFEKAAILKAALMAYSQTARLEHLLLTLQPDTLKHRHISAQYRAWVDSLSKAMRFSGMKKPGEAHEKAHRKQIPRASTRSIAPEDETDQGEDAA